MNQVILNQVKCLQAEGGQTMDTWSYCVLQLRWLEVKSAILQARSLLGILYLTFSLLEKVLDIEYIKSLLVYCVYLSGMSDAREDGKGVWAFGGRENERY